MENDGRRDERVDILLVEPSPGDARLFAESFEEAKLANNFYTVSNGEEALDFVHQRGEHADKPRPDVVLIEPAQPGKNGMELLTDLEEDSAFSDIAVIVLTGTETTEEMVKSHEFDADHYIQKPVEPADFVEFVQSIEEFWLAILERESTAD